MAAAPVAVAAASVAVAGGEVKEAKLGAKAKYFARTWCALLGTLDNPPPLDILSHEDMALILKEKRKELFNNIGTFKLPNADSTKEVKTGKVRVDGDSVTLASQWITFAVDLADALELDAIQAVGFLRAYLAEQERMPDAKDVKLEQVMEFYYYERSCLLGCLCALFRISLSDANHPYFAAVTATLKYLAITKAPGLESVILFEYERLSKLPIPKRRAMERFEIATRWADHVVNEQSLLLEILFMLYYRVVTCSYKTTEKLASLFQEYNFGKHQVLYTYLSTRGRRTVEWISQLCVLIMIEVLQLEELLKIWSRPRDDPKWEAESKKIYLAHPILSDKEQKDNGIANLDHEFFRSRWTTSPQHGPLLLAWSVFMSHVFEYKEETAAAADTDERVYAMQKTILLERLEAALRLDPFTVLLDIVKGLHRGELWRDGIDPNLAAYKSIVKGLMWALFQSPCYAAIEQSSQHHKLYPIFCQIFTDEQDLCLQFWERDVKDPLVRPLLEDALKRFPVDAAPLLDILAAVSGRSATAKRLEAPPTGWLAETVGNTNAVETKKATMSEDEQFATYCAQQVYSFVFNMTRLTSSRPPAELLDAARPVSSHDTSTLSLADARHVILRRAWHTSDGVLIPAGTVADVVLRPDGNPTPFLTWRLEWSAWPLLLRRLQAVIKSTGGGVAAVDWPALTAIVHLIYKVVSGDFKLCSLLQAHLDDVTVNGGSRSSSTSTSLIVPVKGRGVQLAALMLRLFRFLAISSSSAARAGASSSSSTMFGGAPANSNTSFAGGSLDATSSFTSTLLGGSAGATSMPGMPDDALLMKVLRATAGVLVASSRAAPKVFARHLSFTFTPAAADEEAGFISSLAGAGSPSVSFVSCVRMLLQNIETTQGSYPATMALLDIMTALVPHDHRNTSTSAIGGTSGLDMQALLRYVCTDVFVRYDSWRYYKRSERWAIGLNVLRLFHTILSAPAFTEGSLRHHLYHLFLHESAMQQALLKPLVFGVGLCEQLSSERKFTELDLFEDFMSQTFVVVHQLLRIQRSHAQSHPLAGANHQSAPSYSSSPIGDISSNGSIGNGSGVSPARKRKESGWVGTSSDDISYDAAAHFTRLGFGTNKRVSPTPLRPASDNSDVADMDGSDIEGNDNGRGLPPLPSFHQILLDSSFSPNSSSSSSSSADHPPSLVQSIAQYAAYSRSPQIQILAVQTVTFLCSPTGMDASMNHSLAGYLGPSVTLLRRACFMTLTAKRVNKGMREAVLELLATCFEWQEGLAERFLQLGAAPQSKESLLAGVTPAAQKKIDKESLLAPIKDLLARSRQLFSSSNHSEPSLLSKIFHIIYQLWEAAPGYHNLAAVLQSQEAKLWAYVCDPLMEDIPLAEELMAMEVENKQGSLDPLHLRQMSVASQYCERLMVRSWIMQILALEIYTNAPDRLNGTLSRILEILINKGLHTKWLEQYTRCDEDPNIAALVEMSHQLRIDMAAFLYTPASSTRSSCAPVYDVALLARSLADQIQEVAGDDDEESMSTERKVELRQRTLLATEFVTKLRDANRSWMIADAQLVLLKSWKHFIQTAILKHPVALGFTLSSSLPWTYIMVLSERLRTETRFGDGYLITLSSQEVASLLFQLLTYFLTPNEPSRLRILMSSIVEYEATQNPKATEWNIIRQAKGKGFEDRVYSLVAYRATELLSTLSTVANRASSAYLPVTLSSATVASTLPTPISSSSGLGMGIVRTMSVAGGRLGPLRSYSAASTIMDQTLPSDQGLNNTTSLSSSASSRLLNSTRNNSGDSSKASSGYAKAMQLVQSVLGSSLLLLKWSSTLLTAQTTPNVALALEPRSTARRLEAALLPTVDENGDGVAGVLRRQPGATQQYLKTASEQLCLAAEILVPCACTCLPQQNTLAPVAVTLLPLAIQALSAHRGDMVRSQAAERTEATCISTIANAVPILLSRLAAATRADSASALRVIHVLLALSQQPGGAHALWSHTTILYLCNQAVMRPRAVHGTHGGIARLPADDPCAPYDYSTASTSDGFIPSGGSTDGPRDGTRNGWHRVWCGVIALMSNMLRSLSQVPAFVEQAFEFLTVYQPRLAAAFDHRHRDALTLARLEELEEVSALIYEMEKVGPSWRYRLPALGSTVRLGVVWMVDVYTRLLNDPRALEARCTPVDKLEHDAYPITEKKVAPTGGDDSKRSGAGTKEDELKSPFRRSSSTPESPRHASFLLRSPAVHLMRQRSIADRSTSSFQYADSEPARPEDGIDTSVLAFELFSQRVEYAMCLVLRNSMSFLRLLTVQYRDSGAIESDILFEEQLRVISLSEFADGSVISTAPPPPSGSSNQPYSLAFPSTSFVNLPRRPPLATMIDLINYSLRVLARLADIQPPGSSGVPSTNGIASIAARASPMGTSSSPSLAGIRHVMLYMLEIGLYLLLEHVQLYLTRLLALPHSAHAAEQRAAAQAAAQHAALQQSYGGNMGWRTGGVHMSRHMPLGWPEERPAAAPVTPEDMEQVARAKLLDTYKERLTQLIVKLNAYLGRGEDGSELVLRLTGRITDIVKQLEYHLDSQPQGRHAHLRALLTDRAADIAEPSFGGASLGAAATGHHGHGSGASLASLTGTGMGGAFAGFALPSSASMTASSPAGARRSLNMTPLAMRSTSALSVTIPFSPLGSPHTTRVI